MSDEGMKPCPFCGGVEIEEQPSLGGATFHECAQCGSIGPLERPDATPPQGWNFRAGGG